MYAASDRLTGYTHYIQVSCSECLIASCVVAVAVVACVKVFFRCPWHTYIYIHIYILSTPTHFPAAPVPLIYSFSCKTCSSQAFLRLWLIELIARLLTAKRDVIEELSRATRLDLAIPCKRQAGINFDSKSILNSFILYIPHLQFVLWVSRVLDFIGLSTIWNHAQTGFQFAAGGYKSNTEIQFLIPFALSTLLWLFKL